MTIALMGAGVMGEAVLAGLISTEQGPTEVIVSESRAERATELREKYGVEIVDTIEAARRADTLLIVVKPQDVPTLLDEIAGVTRAGQLVISLAAGVTTESMESRLAEGVAVARVMPNTPALVGAGMAAVAAGAHCGEAELALVEQLLSVTGRVVRVPEDLLDAVTAVSGSGPAYVFLVAEAMTEAGVALGLPEEIASELAVQTVIGSALLMRETGDEPGLLRQRVTSPGGTTAVAVAELEARDLRGTFAAALERARDRGRELAKDG